MKVFIFGAGASLASQKGTARGHQTSPLADNLFDDAYHSHAEAVGLSTVQVDQIRSEYKKDDGWFEQWLTDRWNRISQRETPKRVRTEKIFFGRVALYTWVLMNEVSSTFNDYNGYDIFLTRLDDKENEDFGLISFNVSLHEFCKHL